MTLAHRQSRSNRLEVAGPPSDPTTLLTRAEPMQTSRRGRGASIPEPGALSRTGSGVAGIALRMRRERDQPVSLH